MLHKKQKALTKNHKKAPPPQRPKPHHLMKCEQGTWLRHVPCSHFGGRGGTGPPTGLVPHKKNKDVFPTQRVARFNKKIQTISRGDEFCLELKHE